MICSKFDKNLAPLIFIYAEDESKVIFSQTDQIFEKKMFFKYNPYTCSLTLQDNLECFVKHITGSGI